VGDIVAISSPKFGTLVNRVTTSDQAPAWQMGYRALLDNLHGRGLVAAAIKPR
jgi:fumarylacetoacetate (FAA) hydrolase family protein